MIEREHPEGTCGRCGGPNVSWHAPSPLWNAVMRETGNEGRYGGIVCPLCFAALAAEAGIARHVRVDAAPALVALPTHSPDGRAWDPDAEMWR